MSKLKLHRNLAIVVTMISLCSNVSGQEQVDSSWPQWKPYVKEEVEESDTSNSTLDEAKRLGDLAPARFLGVDRLADKYPSFTPYHYAANNPVLFVDVNGDSIWINDNGQRFLYTLSRPEKS